MEMKGIMTVTLGERNRRHPCQEDQHDPISPYQRLDSTSRHILRNARHHTKNFASVEETNAKGVELL